MKHGIIAVMNVGMKYLISIFAISTVTCSQAIYLEPAESTVYVKGSGGFSNSFLFPGGIVSPAESVQLVTRMVNGVSVLTYEMKAPAFSNGNTATAVVQMKPRWTLVVPTGQAGRPNTPVGQPYALSARVPYGINILRFYGHSLGVQTDLPLTAHSGTARAYRPDDARVTGVSYGQAPVNMALQLLRGGRTSTIWSFSQGRNDVNGKLELILDIGTRAPLRAEASARSADSFGAVLSLSLPSSGRGIQLVTPTPPPGPGMSIVGNPLFGGGFVVTVDTPTGILEADIVDVDGVFWLGYDLPNGTYPMVFDNPGALVRNRLLTVFNGIPSINAPLDVRLGDTNMDGVIDLVDIDRILASYGLSEGDIEWFEPDPFPIDPYVDIDRSGEVDLADIDIAVGNYLMQSD